MMPDKKIHTNSTMFQEGHKSVVEAMKKHIQRMETDEEYRKRTEEIQKELDRLPFWEQLENIE